MHIQTRLIEIIIGQIEATLMPEDYRHKKVLCLSTFARNLSSHPT